jgi:hypothetical protein
MDFKHLWKMNQGFQTLSHSELPWGETIETGGTEVFRSRLQRIVRIAGQK